MKVPLIILFVYAYFVGNSLCKTPIASFVNVCKQSDPQLDNCIIKTIKEMRPYLKKGIPEINIPSLDPLKTSTISMNLDTHLPYPLDPLQESLLPYRADLEFTGRDIEVRNVMEFDIKSLHLDLEKLEIEFSILFSKLFVKGNYELQGHFLEFNLNSSGFCTLNFTDVNFYMKVEAEKVIKNGKEHLHFSGIGTSCFAKDGSAYFDDLIKGNKELTAHTNEVINEDPQEVISKFIPIVQDILRDHIFPVIFNIFDTFSIEELLPK